MKRKSKIFFAILLLICFGISQNVNAAVNVTPGGGSAPPGSGCPECSWTYSSSGLGVRLSLYKYDGKNLKFINSVDLVNQPSSYPKKVNTTKQKYGRYSYTKLGKTIDFAKYDVNAKAINSFGFSTIKEETNWATLFATEVQKYYGDSEEDTIAAAQKMFGETISTNDLSQYYIVAEPTAFIYSNVGKFYTYATGYEYMVILDDIDVYTGSYDWNLWESQGRVTFLGYMFNGMYNQKNSSKKYEGFNDGRYDYYNFLSHDSNTSIVKAVANQMSKKTEIRNGNAYAKSNFPYGVMIFWIGQTSTKIGGCSGKCGDFTGDALLKCAESYCSEDSEVTNSTQKAQCITDKCGYTYTKLSCGSDTTTAGSNTRCGKDTSSNKKECNIVNKDYYSYKVECTTYSTVKYPSTLPSIIQAGEGFEYRVRVNGNKTCNFTFDTALWKFKYAAAYTNTQRTNYLKAIEEFNALSLTSDANYKYDSKTADIKIKINESKKGTITATTKKLVAEDKYYEGDKSTDVEKSSSKVYSYHNGSKVERTIAVYKTDSSNGVYYQLPSVCVSSKDHTTVREATSCGDDNGPYNKYFTNIYADKVQNTTYTTVEHSVSGLNVNNNCDYTIIPNTNDLKCYITVKPDNVCSNTVIDNSKDIIFTLNAVYKDKSKTIRYNLDTVGYKEKNETFNNKKTYKIAKNTINSSKTVKVYGTVTDGTYVANCDKEIIVTPQKCEWIITENPSTGEKTIALKEIGNSSAKYYIKLSTSQTWLQNKSIKLKKNVKATVNGKIVTSTATYTCEYKTDCSQKRCIDEFLPAQKAEIKEYCISNWQIDKDNYSSYEDCYISCTAPREGTCKEQFAPTEIDKIRNYCKLYYANDGYESEATCVNDCAGGYNGGIDYYYRTIENNNPFPQRDANANWLGFEKYITNDEDDNTSSTSSGNPEYEIVLDEGRIKKIQENTKNYNKVSGNDVYNDYIWEDDEPIQGSPYKSKFIHSNDISDGGFQSYFTYIEGSKTS